MRSRRTGTRVAWALLLAVAVCGRGADPRLDGAGALRERGRSDDGIVLLRNVHDERPHGAEALVLVGQARVASGDEEQAARTLQRLQELDPVGAACIMLEAAADEVRRGQADEARILDQRVVALAADLGDPLFESARTRLEALGATQTR